MKRKVLTLIIAIFIGIPTFAQEDLAKDLAAKLTEDMTSQYGLNKKQVKKLKPLNEDFTTKLISMTAKQEKEVGQRGNRMGGQRRGMGQGGPRRMGQGGPRGQRPEMNDSMRGPRPDFNGQPPMGPRPEMNDSMPMGPRPQMKGQFPRRNFENDSTLTDEQKAKMRAQREERRKAREERIKAHEAEAQKIKADYEAGLKEIMTDEQYAKYQEDQQNKRKGIHIK